MSNVSGTNGASGLVGAGYVDLGGSGAAGLSPDALLEYCSQQMNGLDSQINTLMQQQESQLNQEQAVQSVQTALESFGSTGPTSQAQYLQCVTAFQQAIADLPPNDPVAAQLQTQLSTMEGKYGTPGTPLTSEQQTELTNAQAVVAQGANLGVPGGPVSGGDSAAFLAAQQTVSTLEAQQTGSFTQPSGTDWQGTTDALGNLADNIKSNAQIQMLSLQDLVSQQQDAIEQATQMMTSEDNTLLDQAKAIGQ
jgi:hypothetical protein